MKIGAVEYKKTVDGPTTFRTLSVGQTNLFILLRFTYARNALFVDGGGEKPSIELGVRNWILNTHWPRRWKLYFAVEDTRLWQRLHQEEW